MTNMSAMFYEMWISAEISLHDWYLGSLVTNMSNMFERTTFNSDISDWNVSSVTNFDQMFNLVTDLSDNIKGLIHQSFSTNENWPYDWSAFINYAPTDLNSTAPLTIAENQPIGTIVGEFNATDPEGDSITYQLISGEGFSLEPDGTLKTATTIDYESNASSYTIRVQQRMN